MTKSFFVYRNDCGMPSDLIGPVLDYELSSILQHFNEQPSVLEEEAFRSLHPNCYKIKFTNQWKMFIESLLVRIDLQHVIQYDEETDRFTSIDGIAIYEKEDCKVIVLEYDPYSCLFNKLIHTLPLYSPLPVILKPHNAVTSLARQAIEHLS